ncbi:MAG: metal-dependent hydrolase, partial [Gammaproteobacteria bacterium]|nr:metal-dependent hydrolase [Gammaproteobacteria bacterium]
MDLLTQGLLGAVVALSGAKRSLKGTVEIKMAAGIGFFAGLLADVDILIRSSSDTLLSIEYHRHFTHSLLFIPVGAFIAALLLWPVLRNKLVFKRIYYYSLLGYLLSGLLDACTSYGTHLLLPFSQQRVAWHVISIIDPIFTLALFIAMVLAVRKKSFFAARLGLGFCFCYLAFGTLQLQRAESMLASIAQSRGHVMQRHIVKPTLANVFLWRSVYIHDATLYTDAINIGLFSAGKHYAGKSSPLLVLEDEFPGLNKSSVLYQDLKRFEHFSDGYLAFHPRDKNIIGDARYSILPNGINPLWGIEIDREHPDQHA